MEKIPHRKNLSHTEKARLQQIVGEEVSLFLERNSHTERALKDLEFSIETLLIAEGLIKDERKINFLHSHSMSPSKLEKRLDSGNVVNDDYELQITKRAP